MQNVRGSGVSGNRGEGRLVFARAGGRVLGSGGRLAGRVFLGLALFADIKGRDPCHGFKLSQGIGKILARRAPVRHASRNGFVYLDPSGKSAPIVVFSHASKSCVSEATFLRASSSAVLPSNRRNGGLSERAASMIACAARTGSPA